MRAKILLIAGSLASALQSGIETVVRPYPVLRHRPVRAHAPHRGTFKSISSVPSRVFDAVLDWPNTLKINVWSYVLGHIICRRER
jgi:hypothetical protein